MSSPQSVAARDLLAIVARRARLVRRFVGTCTLLTALGAYLLPPTYKTSVSFMVLRDRPPTLTQLSQPNWLVDRNEVIQTEVALLRSKSVIGRAVDICGLVGRPKSTRPLARAKRGLVEGLKATGLLYRAPEREEWIEWISRNIKVKPVVQADVVTLTVEADDPELVGEIGRAMTVAYRERHAEVFRNQDLFGFYAQQVKVSGEALRRLKARQEELKTQLAVSSFDEQRSAFLLQKSQIDEQRRALQATHPRLIAAARTLVEDPSTPASAVSIPDGVAGQYTALADLQKSVADAEQRRSGLARQYRDASDPKVVALTERVSSLRADLAGSLRSAAKDVERRLASLDGTALAVGARFEEFNKTERVLTDLAVEVESAEERYKRYSERLEDVRLNEDSERPVVNVAVIDEAQTPTRPWLPRIVYIVLALVLSSVVGVGLAIVAEASDAGIRSAADAERRLGLPVLVEIPLQRAPRRGHRGP